MTNWKDITTYRAGEKKRVPRTYEVKGGWLRVVVTRHKHLPGDWLLRCNLPGLETVLVATGDDVTIAKRNALKLIEDRLAELQQDLEDIARD